METLDGLYRQYYEWSLNFAWKFKKTREDREDLVADAWCAAARFFDRYEQGTNFKSWLATIMWRLAINQRRHVQRFNLNFVPFEDEWMRCTEAEEPGGYNDYVAVALNKLEPKMRVVLVLKYVYELTQKEVGERVGISIGTVGSRLYRGCGHMRRHLKAA